MQEVDNGLVFLATDGLYFFDGNNSYKISDRITATISTYNSLQFAQASSMYYHNKNRYYLGIPGPAATTNNRVVVWDSFNNALSIYSGWAPSCMEMVYSSGIDERPYFGDYSGYTYRADTGDNDNPLNVETAINAYAYTRWLDFDDLCDKKGIPNIYLYFQNQDGVLTLTYSYDFEESDQYSISFNTALSASLYGSAVYGTATYSGTGGRLVRKDLTGRGRVVRFGFKNANLDQSFRIDGFGTFAHLQTNV